MKKMVCFTSRTISTQYREEEVNLRDFGEEQKEYQTTEVQPMSAEAAKQRTVK